MASNNPCLKPSFSWTCWIPLSCLTVAFYVGKKKNSGSLSKFDIKGCCDKYFHRFSVPWENPAVSFCGAAEQRRNRDTAGGPGRLCRGRVAAPAAQSRHPQLPGNSQRSLTHGQPLCSSLAPLSQSIEKNVVWKQLSTSLVPPSPRAAPAVQVPLDVLECVCCLPSRTAPSVRSSQSNLAQRWHFLCSYKDVTKT